MPVTCTYASGVLAFYIRGKELDTLISGDALVCDLTLRGEVLEEDCFSVYLRPFARDLVRTLVQAERQAMREQMHKVQNSIPGYSNRKIRKGKGHGKG